MRLDQPFNSLNTENLNTYSLQQLKDQSINSLSLRAALIRVCIGVPAWHSQSKLWLIASSALPESPVNI